MKSFLKISSFSFLTLVILPLDAQGGDNKDSKSSKVQKDPIPVDQIPASPYLDRQQALKSFEVADGFVIENIAEQNVHQPVSISFDADGRAWVVEMTNYMMDVEASDENKPAGHIKVLEDTDGDGSLDKTTIFLDKLILPRACAVTSDGLLYAHQDQLFFIKRGGTDGTTHEGDPVLVDRDYAIGGNAEHKPNGLLLARDNWYYNAKSEFRYRRVKGKWLKEKTAFRGQWGITQNDAGILFTNNNSKLLLGDETRPNLYRHHPLYTPKHTIGDEVVPNRIYPIRMNPGVNRAYNGKILDKAGKLINCTAAAGMTIYRGQNFPEQYYGSAFVSVPCGNLVKAINISYSDTNKPMGSFPLKDKEFIASTDEWFRPVNIYTAPDGTLWVIDMYMGLIQHKTYLTSYLRKQYLSRGLDKPQQNNGRIYRVRYTGNTVGEVPKMSTATIAQLQTYLSHPNGTVRDTAQRLIVERITTNTNDYAKWDALNAQPNYTNLGLLHALWVYEAVRSVPHGLIEKGLLSENTDIVNSSFELAQYSSKCVAQKILNFAPSTHHMHSYIFALGKFASPESHKKAISLMKEFKKQTSQLEAVYVSGLGEKTADIIALKIPMDKQLADMLNDAVNSVKSKVVKRPVVPEIHKKRYELGKSLYLGSAACSGCHGAEGQGQGNLFPPLAQSEWVNDNAEVLGKIILHGFEGPIKVNEIQYKGDQAMPAYKSRLDLSDEDLASLMTYIRYMKGNKGGVVTADQIKKIKNTTKNREAAYTEKELRKELR